MKFRVPPARGKAGPKQTRAANATGAKPPSTRKRRKGPHTDLPDDPIEDALPLYGDDDGSDRDYAPMDAEPAVVPEEAKTWPPVRSTRAREKAPESQQSTVAETQLTTASSSEEPVEGCYGELMAFREMVRLRPAVNRHDADWCDL